MRKASGPVHVRGAIHDYCRDRIQQLREEREELIRAAADGKMTVADAEKQAYACERAASEFKALAKMNNDDIHNDLESEIESEAFDL
jgi:regulator of protease activity HflC (stomatin/prohibitin superfamily)